ncbi:hypothetical protein AMATHDRAFT_68154 [Amanita thiersii Skay4041]|uniref:Uncharacterized protein n=1 Tax=Amanita thiersii Skay4041 TaxID=703135 RepID=A0A2A9NG36_9AGAR|nr:hypothetical protein AMATHDRAFT_68154 [Amanita thiersii Skay4041]
MRHPLPSIFIFLFAALLTCVTAAPPMKSSTILRRSEVHESRSGGYPYRLRLSSTQTGKEEHTIQRRKDDLGSSDKDSTASYRIQRSRPITYPIPGLDQRPRSPSRRP